MLFICLFSVIVNKQCPFVVCHAFSILCLGQHFAEHRGGRHNYGPGNNQGHKVAVGSHLVVAWPFVLK